MTKLNTYKGSAKINYEIDLPIKRGMTKNKIEQEIKFAVEYVLNDRFQIYLWSESEGLAEIRCQVDSLQSEN
jgi:hypothetical protein